MKKIASLIILMVALICVLSSCNFDLIQRIKDGNWEIGGDLDLIKQSKESDRETDGEKEENPVPDDENPLGLVFFLKEDGTYAVEIGQAKYLSKIEIPTTYKGKAVTEIGHFQGYNFKEITIPNSVEVIDALAFANCSALTSIVLSESVTSIGMGAFYGCDSLESITLPFVGANKDGITNTHFGYIFGAALADINAPYLPASLKTVVITGGDNIGDYAFQHCGSLTNVMIYDSVVNIGEGAFYNCNALTNITLPNSVENIGRDAFFDCSALTSITLPFVGDKKENPTVTRFDYYFGNTVPASLKTVVLTGGSSIGENAFYGCINIENITIPDSVTSIGNASFRGCNSLTNIIIPNSVTSIGNFAFASCGSLMSIIIPDSVTSIGKSAFSNCISLTSITIPDSVTSIGYNTFFKCDSLECITLPFVGAIKDDYYNAHFGYIFGASSYSSNAGAVPASLKTVIVTGGTKIFERAFYNCDYLTSVTLPDSVVNLGEYVFAGCSELSNVVLGNSLLDIGLGAFYNCSSLASITIPKNIRRIDEMAFRYCDSLRSVTFENPNGWQQSSYSYSTFGEDISADDLSNLVTAARYLKSTYSSCYWFRTEQ